MLITADDAEAPTDPNAESAPVPVAELDELCAVLVDGYPAMTATSSTGEKRLVVADVDRRLDAAVSALGSLAANADRSLDEVNALLDNAVGTVGSLPSALDSAQEPQVDFPASRLDAQLLAATDELERMGAASCASPPRLLPG